jgi:hypothetical protein
LRGLFEAVLPSTKQHGVVRARGPQIHPSIHPSIDMSHWLFLPTIMLK